MREAKSGKVYFIGAGPGDPELLTLKAQKLMEEADLILYAGSLVSETVLRYASPGAEVHSTARMSLDAQINMMTKAVNEGKLVLRLHTGDPSIFSALDEQTRALDKTGIAYEVVPGVSSAFAAAAALGLEFTLPEITQTLMLTRVEGHTPVPELENLRELAAHHSSLAIFLSTGMISKVVEQLLAAGYEKNTPIAVVYRASWPDQMIVRGTLSDIVSRLDSHELSHQGMIIVSPALSDRRSSVSHLYGGFQVQPSRREGIAIFALTRPALTLGKHLAGLLQDARLFIPEKYASEFMDDPRIVVYEHGLRDALQTGFKTHKAMICIMAAGIVMRELAPVLTSKHQDPALLLMDANGKYVVSLLSGHEGGANELAKDIAGLIDAQAVTTTASDIQNIPALDVLVKEHGWKLDPQGDLAAVMAAFVNQEAVVLTCEPEIKLPEWLLQLPWQTIKKNSAGCQSEDLQKEVILSCRKLLSGFANKLCVHPPVLCVGIGCNRGTPAHEILDAIQQTFERHRLAFESVTSLASVSDKADETGLLELAENQGWTAEFFSHDEIQEVQNYITPSDAPRKALGVPGVAEPCALLHAKTTKLLVPKEKYTNVTVAVALKTEAL